jgi:hypothetical protein
MMTVQLTPEFAVQVCKKNAIDKQFQLFDLSFLSADELKQSIYKEFYNKELKTSSQHGRGEICKQQNRN